MSHGLEHHDIAIDGVLTRIQARGSGPVTYVLIHGIGVSSRYFQPLARALAPHGRVLLFDLPGFGAAPKPRRSMSISEYAGVVWKCLDALEIERPVLVGHSMGCQTVVEMARQRDSAQGTVLLGPTVNRHERSLWKQMLRLAQDTLIEPARVNWIVFSDYLLRCGPRWYLKTVPSLLGYRIDRAIVHVRGPLLILRGAQDPIVPRYWTRELAAQCGEARVADVPSEGHVMMYRKAAWVAAHCRTLAGRV